MNDDEIIKKIKSLKSQPEKPVNMNPEEIKKMMERLESLSGKDISDSELNEVFDILQQLSSLENSKIKILENEEYFMRLDEGIVLKSNVLSPGKHDLLAGFLSALFEDEEDRTKEMGNIIRYMIEGKRKLPPEDFDILMSFLMGMQFERTKHENPDLFELIIKNLTRGKGDREGIEDEKKDIFAKAISNLGPKKENCKSEELLEIIELCEKDMLSLESTFKIISEFTTKPKDDAYCSIVENASKKNIDTVKKIGELLGIITPN